MGLDMHLTKKRFIWSEERKKLKIKGIKGINSEKVNYIIEESIYWRKVNAIHQWFVENIQDGKDDCEEYYVSIELLKELLELIKEVLKNKKLAEEELPIQSGFFFGGTDYDEYYWQELKRTKKELTDLLKQDNKQWEFYYCSSW